MTRTTLICLLAVSIAPGSPRAEESETAQLRKRLDELEDRLDTVEKRTVLDRLELGAEYRVIFNAYSYKGPSPNPWDLIDPTDSSSRRTINTSTAEILSHRFRLKIRAEPISSLRFTARLAGFKHFGDTDEPVFVQDFATTRIPRSSGVRLDQAWIDWFITDWLALSAGRPAFAEGNPAELRENSTVRKGTWGIHTVDGEYEAINLTFNLSRFWDGFYVRLFYSSTFYDNDDDILGGFPFLNSGADSFRIFGGNIDLKIPKMGKNLIQIGYFTIPSFPPQTIPIPDPAYSPADDHTHAPMPLAGSLLFPSAMPDTLGSYQTTSLLVEFYDFFKTGIDWFAAGSVGFLFPSGEGIAYDLPQPGAGPLRRQSTPFLFLASQGDDEHIGYLIYAGIRYTVPWKIKAKIGFEFNYGSKYHVSFAMPTDQLLSKIAIRGKAFETYLIVPINKHLFLRAAHLYIDNDYQSGFFSPNPALTGTPSPRFDQRIHSFQVLIDASI